MSLFLIFISGACNAQPNAELNIGAIFTDLPGDSIRYFEVSVDSVILDTLGTISMSDSVFTVVMPFDNKKHYFQAQGYVLEEDLWSPFSNVIDTFLVAPPTIFFFKKK